MESQRYDELAGLEQVYLEDSYVLTIEEGPSDLKFLLDLVLKEDHPEYVSPEAGDQYCYRRAWLVFPNVQRVCWLENTMQPYSDATGSVDYGNIDVLLAQKGHYHVEGDWGTVEVVSSSPRIKLIEGVEASGRSA